MLFTNVGFRATAFGLTLWASGVGIIRAFPQLVPPEDNPTRQMALLAATIPISWVTVKSLPLIGIPAAQKLPAMAIGSAAACLADGIAVGLTDWYSKNDVAKKKVGSALLFAIGTGIMIAAA